MLNKTWVKWLGTPVAGALVLTAVNLTAPDASMAQTRRRTRAVQTTQLNTDYTLDGGDRIQVNVLDVQDYTKDYTIPPGGSINLPLIGSVSLQGLTTEQAADLISSRYARFLKRPLISVNLLSPRPINVTVSGEVTRPGGYSLSLQGGAGDNPGVQYPTVLAALTTAQGVTLAADITRVQLRRRLGNGGEQVVSINVRDIIQTGNKPLDITLRDGDSIFVPIGNNLSLSEIRQLSYAGIAPDPTRPRTVVITGEVNRPGSYLVTTEGGGGGNNANTNTGLPTVSRALQLAGGITTLADVRNVTLRRRTRNGNEQAYKINLLDVLARGDVNQDTLLQDGDTIEIPTGNMNLAEVRQLSQTNIAGDITKPRAVAVIGEVYRPGTYLVGPSNSGEAGGGGNNSSPFSNSVGGQPTVTRAIQLAGGITSLADVRNIRIRRPTKTGSEQLIDINLWKLIQSGDLAQDTILQEGDTVVIPTTPDTLPEDQTVLATTTLSPAFIQANVVGEVKRPGVVQIQPNTSLTQAILAAGGFNDARAKSTEVDLVRLNPDGSVTKRSVKVDFYAGINDQTNPIIRNNDLVLVRRSGITQVGDAAENAIRPFNPILSILRLIFGGF